MKSFTVDMLKFLTWRSSRSMHWYLNTAESNCCQNQNYLFIFHFPLWQRKSLQNWNQSWDITLIVHSLFPASFCCLGFKLWQVSSNQYRPAYSDLLSQGQSSVSETIWRQSTSAWTEDSCGQRFQGLAHFVNQPRQRWQVYREVRIALVTLTVCWSTSCLKLTVGLKTCSFSCSTNYPILQLLGRPHFHHLFEAAGV